MTQNFVSLVSGVLFGFGLCLSEMINPRVVIGFLDVTGDWNPALLFVMAGALLVTGLAFPFILKGKQPVCAPEFNLPKKSKVDAPLIRGGIMFGLGWGLAGICPGPAIAAIALAKPVAYWFVAAMFAGMGIFELFDRFAKESP